VSFSIDVNILLYASDSNSQYYENAKFFLKECIQKEELFCLGWTTVMGYLRIATHPSIFANPLTSNEAATNIETLLNLPHTRFIAEEEGFWDIYQKLNAEIPARGNFVPDIHLAAVLKQHGVKKIYTNDRDFLKFPFLKVINPLENL